MKSMMHMGMGDPAAGAVCWTDTGDGITPGNYQSQCCGFFGKLKPSCLTWTYQNSDLFSGGSTDPCSDTAGVRLGLSIPSCFSMQTPVPNAPPVVPFDPASGLAVTPSGKPISTPEEANAAINDMIAATSSADKATIQAWIAQQAKTQCGSQAAICSKNALFRKVSADCTSCALDFSSGYFWAGALGLLFGVVVLVKLA